MNNYFIICMGWLIGQAAFTVISAYLLQIDKPNIDYPTALKVFVKSETGNYAIAFVGLIIAMFVFKDYIDPKITRDQLLQIEHKTFVQKAILYSRTASVAYGAFCPLILLMWFKRGVNAIKQFSDQNQANATPESK